MMITQAEIKKYNLQSGDSEGLVNYPFKIEGVKVAPTLARSRTG